MTVPVMSPQDAAAVLHRYVESVASGDAASVAALFAPDGVLRDPVDGVPHRGREEICLFFDESFHAQGPIRMAVEGAVRVAGQHVAAALTASIPSGNRTLRIDTLDVLQLDADGLIVSLDAYWGPSNIRLLS